MCTLASQQHALYLCSSHGLASTLIIYIACFIYSLYVTARAKPRAINELTFVALQ